MRQHPFFAFLFSLGLLFGLLGLGAPLSAKEESYEGKVVLLKLGEDSLAHAPSFRFIERTLQKAEKEKATALILELNTPGGLAWETSELMMTHLRPLKVPVLAFVNTKAMSAGALIAASCPKIYMAPVSSIGAAGIVDSSGKEMDPMMRKKLESAFGAFTRSVVSEQGHNPEIIKAMMVPKEENAQYGSVSVDKGQLLTLTGKEACETQPNGKPLLATAIAHNVQEILSKENMTAPLIEAQSTGFESIALWIAKISPLLILIGIGAIYWEFKTPGLGMGAVVAALAFGLFFFGNNMAGNLAGYETVALFVVGLIFLVIEFFILPGWLIFGVIGAFFLLFGLFGGMIDSLSWTQIWENEALSGRDILLLLMAPFWKLSLGLGGAVGLIMLLMRYFPQIPFMQHLANDSVSGNEKESISLYKEEKKLPLGAVGISVTELRPVGKMEFEGRYYEVSARDGFHPKGTPVRVLKKEAYQIIVEKASGEEEQPEEL